MNRINEIFVFAYFFAVLFGAIVFLAVILSDVSYCESVVVESNPDQRFIYSGGGWMLDLQENQSVSMKEALRRVQSLD